MNSVMTKVYVRMFVGLLISAFCALGVASSPALRSVIIGNQIVFWGMLIGMLVMAWVIPARAMSMNSTTLFGLFCLFAALMGAYLAPIFLVFKLGTITYTFFITAGTFGAMSVYGYFTKRDLTKIGTYLIMALIGLIILSIVNWFLKSGPMEWVISIVGLFIFIGLTAWDTQQMRRIAESNLDPAVSDRLATIGAMNLYLDFINLFLFILRIFGDRN
ncbi:MAG: Bax inhibitor-1/YccA family protein [Muribaculaceae bacterium]|nr:Bax inhibitor-1/YccA family protein [Muribaculaceae bacterium]